ncbi:MAG: DUF4440 domain-containing protein [candidate division Zixibacteria bacterium]|nr:DUF4440 domain-containing protein [candidate division Zixibacteria bacterium]
MSLETDAQAAAADIVALEKTALTRWGNGDPHGFVGLSSEDMTYFDPDLATRLDGHAAYGELMVSLEGKISVARFEMPNHRVQLYGDVGILTFNLVNCNADDTVRSRWNSTEVYHKQEGAWKLVHSHWSLTRPAGD